MKKAVFALSLLALSLDAAAEWYAGAAAGMTLAGGGSELARRPAVFARTGTYLDDYTALELEAGTAFPCAALGARAVWHLANIPEFGRLFGYERFDPFITFGARGFIGSAAGPSAGCGALYYLGDTWALRFDADWTLALGEAGGAGSLFALAFGVQYTF